MHNFFTECPGNKRRIFTIETDVVAVTALNIGTQLWPLSSLMSVNPNAVWCVKQPSEFRGNTVNITFTSPVILDTIVTRGDLQGAPEFVSNVTFNYIPNSGADQEYLQVRLSFAEWLNTVLSNTSFDTLVNG